MELKNPEHAKCIVRNYLYYLKSRNMVQFMDSAYMKMLERLPGQECDIRKIVIEPTKNMCTGSPIKNYTLRLFLSSPKASGELSIAADYNSQYEFLCFLKKHIIIISLDKECDAGISVVKTVNKSPFNF